MRFEEVARKEEARNQVKTNWERASFSPSSCTHLPSRNPHPPLFPAPPPLLFASLPHSSCLLPLGLDDLHRQTQTWDSHSGPTPLLQSLTLTEWGRYSNICHSKFRRIFACQYTVGGCEVIRGKAQITLPTTGNRHW